MTETSKEPLDPKVDTKYRTNVDLERVERDVEINNACQLTSDCKKSSFRIHFIQKKIRTEEINTLGVATGKEC